MDVENLLARASDNLSVRRAFGAAYEKDGTLIIPVALVAGGGGGTSRSRRGNSAPGPDVLAPPDATPQESGPADAGGRTDAVEPADADGRTDAGGRADAGGGFGGVVLPAGAYVVKGDQVRWVPAVNPNLVVLASVSLVRILASAWVRRSAIRRRR
jgi:uncharacterized spore protein YtfJ